MKPSSPENTARWARHHIEWRDPAQVASQWPGATEVDARLLESTCSRGWWDLLAELGLTLLVTREYEHLAVAASAPGGRPRQSFFPLPHPSGLAVDRSSGRVFVAATRNPNQVFRFEPTNSSAGSPLIPVSSAYYPGSLYLHDLALVSRQLYGNAVGQNCVVRLHPDGRYERAWWPRCIEAGGRPVFNRNHIQLNSIAAGGSLATSFFSASSSTVGRLRPGHLNYPVDRTGVIFSGRTREPLCGGLTRPHSARLFQRRLWVANSGYGEFGYVRDGRLEVVARLPGWTRGLCIVGDTAFVGTSHVIPRFARYAPGLDPAACRCAVHAICLRTGRVLGSMEWPSGNQIFAIDWLNDKTTSGLPFDTKRRNHKRDAAFFYRYSI